MLNVVLILMSEDAEFNIDDPVRSSNHKNIFAKHYAPNWSKEVFFG